LSLRHVTRVSSCLLADAGAKAEDWVAAGARELRNPGPGGQGGATSGLSHVQEEPERASAKPAALAEGPPRRVLFI